MKKYANDMIAGDVFHPSETIRDEMEAQAIKQVDLVNATGYNKSHISLLLNGKRGVTIQIAMALEKTLNISAEFWIRLQKNYELQMELSELQKHKHAS